MKRPDSVDCGLWLCAWREGERQMRAVVQRVVSASVEVLLLSPSGFFSHHKSSVDGRTVSEIGPGLLVLVGLHESDVESDADFMYALSFSFLASLSCMLWRYFAALHMAQDDLMSHFCFLDVMQKKYGVLLVSQFTLFGILKGNKPDFHVAMPPNKAKPFYELLVDKFHKSYDPDSIKGGYLENHGMSIPDMVFNGVFGAMMKVNYMLLICNDTIDPSKLAVIVHRFIR
ncbi:D-tyrosyl-tRNA(Tyr) deacylase [Asimina triloba]